MTREAFVERYIQDICLFLDEAIVDHCIARINEGLAPDESTLKTVLHKPLGGALFQEEAHKAQLFQSTMGEKYCFSFSLKKKVFDGTKKNLLTKVEITTFFQTKMTKVEIKKTITKVEITKSFPQQKETKVEIRKR